jgi:hypothetical protein
MMLFVKFAFYYYEEMRFACETENKLWVSRIAGESLGRVSK